MTDESAGSHGGPAGRDTATTADERLFLPALESLVAGTVESSDEDGWLAEGVPLLVRGEARILPCFWRSEPALGAPDPQLDARSTDLWTSIRGWCWYQRGDAIGVDLSPEPRSDRPVAYANELRRTGARRADWWGFGERAVVSVVYGDAIPAPIVAEAVHVVPKHWVWYDRARPGDLWRITEMPATSLQWSGADVIALR